MTTYEELKARGLIAQVTDEEKVKELVDAEHLAACLAHMRKGSGR